MGELSALHISSGIFWGVIIIWALFSGIVTFHLLFYGKSVFALFMLAIYGFFSLVLIGSAYGYLFL